MTSIWTALSSTDPSLPWVLLPTLLWLVQWAVRYKWPAVWQQWADRGPVASAASKAWQALPSVVIGAVLCASATGLNPRDLALAALVSCGAPVWHELLRYVTDRVTFLPTYVGGTYPAAGTAPRPGVPTVPDP